jgi:transcriptional regulator with XRE-family HTH domain
MDAVERTNADAALGTFLRARRARVDPSDLGLPATTRRRTPGLRREEVATLAGVSVEYLTRLEQGRSSRPSTEVLDALARALRLDREAHRHLRLLAGVAPPPVSPPADVRPALVEALEALAPKPAYLISPRMELLATTPAARALLGPLGDEPRPSFPRWFFLDPRSRDYHADWAADAANCVANLRLAVRPDRPDPLLDALVAELEATSVDFRRWWDDHEVRPCATGVKHFVHPVVGPFSAAYESLPTADQTAFLVLYRPHGDDRSRTAFDLLTTISLTPDLAPQAYPSSTDTSP